MGRATPREAGGLNTERPSGEGAHPWTAAGEAKALASGSKAPWTTATEREPRVSLSRASPPGHLGTPVRDLQLSGSGVRRNVACKGHTCLTGESFHATLGHAQGSFLC